MTHYKAILIDDEKKLLEVLKIKITKCCPDIRIVGQAANAEDGYRLIKNLEPDIVFLDIGMPEESGFDMLQRFDQIDFEIIFVTGYNDYALKAIQYCAIGYILKPVNSEELKQAIRNAISRIKSKISKTQFRHFFELLNNPESSQKKFGIPTIDGIEFVKINEIIHCETRDRHTKVFLEDKSFIESTYKLHQFQKLLAEHNFFMPHKSHLVNLHQILKYDKEGILIMTDGTMIPLSRRKKLLFLQSMERLR